MGRYTEKFWDNQNSDLENAVGGMFTLGLTTLMKDPELAYKCEITDSKTGLVGITEDWMPNKTIAHDVAWHDLEDKQQAFYENIRVQQQQELRKRNKKSNSNDESDPTATIIKWVVYVALFLGAVWLAFAVTLPLIVINCAAISFIIALTLSSDKKKYMFLLSLLGGIYIVIDYNKGLTIKTLVENVSFFEKAIPFFLYLNIAAGLIASYFLIRDFINERKKPTVSDGEFSKRNLIIMGSLIAVGATTVLLQRHFDSQGGTSFYRYNSAQTITVPNNSGTNSGNGVNSQADTSVGRADTSMKMVSSSTPNNNYVNGTFTGAWFKVTVPSDFTAKPSMRSSSGNGYESVFFDSPDGDVEFYVFSPQWGGEPNDISIDANTEKVISTLSQTSNGLIKTWNVIQALDGSYYRSYQDTKAQGGNIHWIIGLKYKSKAAHEKYKQAYLSFKKSLIQLSD